MTDIQSTSAATDTGYPPQSGFDGEFVTALVALEEKGTHSNRGAHDEPRMARLESLVKCVLAMAGSVRVAQLCQTATD